MTLWWVVGISVLALAGLTAYIVAEMNKKPAGKAGQPAVPPANAHGKQSQGPPSHADKALTTATASAPMLDKASFVKQAEQDVEHIFNDQFREELRNRGRLHFEKIIGENAMFLQQDLRLTTAQLNDYMKQEISAKLKEEFEKYEQSIIDAKEMAIDSIEKTKQAVEENRRQLLKQLEQEFAEEKAREIKRFDENMTDVVNHYLIAAIGDQIDLSDQLEYILSNLEANKQAIIQDIVNGA